MKNNLVLSEKKMVIFFKKYMKNQIKHFKYAEEINVNPQRIDFSYFDPIKKILIGIEFKKKNWSKVFIQASKVRYFFHKMFVCIEEPKTDFLKNKIISEAKKRNIGLIFFIEKTTSFNTIFEPSVIHNNIFEIIYTKRKSLFEVLSFQGNNNG